MPSWQLFAALEFELALSLDPLPAWAGTAAADQPMDSAATAASLISRFMPNPLELKSRLHTHGKPALAFAAPTLTRAPLSAG